MAPMAEEAKRPTDPQERQQAIIAAIRELDPEDFTTKGLPTAHAIEARLGYGINAGERDAAWAVIEAEKEKQNDEEPDGDAGQDGPGSQGSEDSPPGHNNTPVAAPVTAPDSSKPLSAVRVLIPGLSPDGVRRISERIRSRVKDVQVSLREHKGSQDQSIWVETRAPDAAYEDCLSIVESFGHVNVARYVKIETG